MEQIFVYGAGGHGRVVLDALHSGRRAPFVRHLVDDDPELHGQVLLGHPITSPRDIGNERGFIAIGDNASRREVASRYKGRLVVIAHPAAILAADAVVGEGTVLMAGSIVHSGCRIGENVIINTAASVDHDCEIEDGVHIAPGCRLCGDVRVGNGTLLGAGTIVVPGIRIGKDVLVHAGQTVTSDVPDGATVRGPRPWSAPSKSSAGPSDAQGPCAPIPSPGPQDRVSPSLFSK